MERVGHADVGVRLIADLGRHHEARDARHVGLERGDDQVELQAQQIVEARPRDGHVGQVDLREIALAQEFEPPLDLAHAVEVIVDERAVLAAERALQARRLGEHHVEQALVVARDGAALGVALAAAEDLLERLARRRTPSAAASSACGTRSCGRSCSRRCRRTRRRRLPPRSRPRARAGRVLGRCARRDLIDGDAAERRVALPRVLARQPRGRHDRVHGRALAGLVAEAADDGQVFLQRLERLEDRLEVEVAARPCPASSDSSRRRSACCS